MAMKHIMRTVTRAGIALVLLLVSTSATSAYDWPQFFGDAAHRGSNTQENALGVGNAATLQSVFNVTLPATADGAPAYLANVGTAGGTKDVLFVTTTDGRIIAFDAHTGAQIWAQQYPSSSYGPSGCSINVVPPSTGGSPCFTTSSPAVDPNGLYVYSYGLDGKVHKYTTGAGAETTTDGWPQITTLKGFQEKGSSALSIATPPGGVSYLYVATGGYPGDAGDYQGHITTINLTTGTQRVFNATCTDQTVHFVQKTATPDCSKVETAVWARPGVVYSAETNRVYFSTGNGDFAPGSHWYGDSVLALNPDGTGNGSGDPVDSYTPANEQALDDADLDLGSAAPALLPTVANCTVPHLAVQTGKDGQLRLLNQDSLGFSRSLDHKGGEIAPIIPAPQNIGVSGFIGVNSQPVVWTNPADGHIWLFVANGRGISGSQLVLDSSGNPSLSSVWKYTSVGSQSSPAVANGVLYWATNNSLRAFDATSGTQLWQSTQPGAIHWQSPVVANGVLYLSDSANHLHAFAAPPTVSAVTPNQTSVFGGTPVAITGSGFVAGSTVTVDGVGVSGLVIENSSQLTFTAPAHAVGGATVVIRTPVGQTVTTSYFAIGRPAAPTVASVANPAPPLRPAATGTSVIIADPVPPRRP